MNSPINAVNASPDVSHAYRFISTETIMALLGLRGFELHSETIVKPRKKSKLGYQVHYLRFNHPALPKLDDSQVQLLVKNSHDGKSSLQFSLGVFRYVCSNGLVVGNSFFTQRIRHVGDVAGNIGEAIKTLVARAVTLSTQIEQLKAVYLPEGDVVRELNMITGINYVNLGPVRRTEDALEEGDSTAWQLLNRLQENLVRGGLTLIKGIDGKNATFFTEIGKSRGRRSASGKNEASRLAWEVVERVASIAA